MRTLLRLIVGFIFSSTFLLFLLVSGVQYKLLSPSYWNKALQSSGLYQQLQGNIGNIFSFDKKSEQNLEQLRKNYSSGKIPAKERENVRQKLEFVDVLKNLNTVLTAEKIQNLVERNIENLLAFMNGQRSDIVLYLPMKSIGLPEKLIKQLGLTSFGEEETSLEAVLTGAWGKEAAVTGIKQLGTLQSYIKYVQIAWMVLGAMSIVILIVFYILGADQKKKISGTGWLLLESGSLVAILSTSFIVGSKTIAQSISTQLTAAQSASALPIVLTVVPGLVKGFFEFGVGIGVAVVLVGVALIWWSRSFAAKKSK